jgi:glycerophosphoryl diester phosphodiesterase
MNRRRRQLVTGATALPFVMAPVARAQPRWPYPTLAGTTPLVIAHRGASGERPEHTLAAYELAIDQGADFIEPDLVSTRDGVLVARHDVELSLTTDVASRPQFSARRRTQTIDGKAETGWFVDDFSWDELQTLRARERWPQWRPGSAAFDGKFAIPSLAQVIDLLRVKEKTIGRRIGLYPETKHPGYFAARGLALEAPLVRALHEAGWRARDDAVFLQSFEADSLRTLAGLTRLRRVQLMGGQKLPDAGALRSIAGYAQGLGAAKALVIPRTPDGKLAAPTALVAQAHEAGLAVHVWTFRRENNFLPIELADRPDEELRRFLALGIDGVFADQPGAARALVDALALGHSPSEGALPSAGR